MKIGDFSIGDIEKRMRQDGMIVSVGPFHFRARSHLRAVAPVFHDLYEHYPAPDQHETIVDFTVSVEAAGTSRALGLGQRLANFDIDGMYIRDPFPRTLAFPYLEWAANYAFGTRMHNLLLVHAAVIAQGEKAIALPGRPGAGKSTLTAALVARGWRFLSDEFLIIDPASGDLIAFPRPISLKERSIDVIRDWAPDTHFSPMFEGTHKGLVAYMRVPQDSVAAALDPCRLCAVIFPLFEPGAGLTLDTKSKARALLEMADNSFNYEIRGQAGFEDLRRAFEGITCFDLRYDDLEAAAKALRSLL